MSTFGVVAIYLRYSKRQQLSSLNTGIGISFVMLYNVLSFTLIALTTLVILLIFGQARAYLYITLLILVVVVVLVILFIMNLAIYKAAPSRPVLWLIKSIAKLAGKKNIKIEEIEEIFLEIGADVKKNKDKIGPGLWLAIAAHFINILTLAFVFLAFAGSFNILAVIATFTAGLLYTIVSVTPQGVGVAETIMITTICSFGIDLPTAAVVTLVYRSLLHWLPLFAGFYSLSRLELESNQAELKEGSLNGQNAL